MCRASKDSGRAKIEARAKKEKEQGGGGNLRSHATHSTLLVRERLLRRLLLSRKSRLGRRQPPSIYLRFP